MMMTISKLLYLDIGTGKCELQHQLTSESSLQQLVTISQRRNHCLDDVQYIYAKVENANDSLSRQKQINLSERIAKFGSLQAMDKNNVNERDTMLKEDAKWRKRVNGDYRQLDEMSVEAFVKSGRNL